MTLPLLDNCSARRLFLDRHALIEPPTGPAAGADLLALIHRLGFVQVDSIATVERAHHMILWSRRQSYRPANLARLLERDRTLFEHWTHDAAVIPTAFYPHWHLRFARDRDWLIERWTKWQGDGFLDRMDEVLARVAETGPVSSAEVGEDEARSSGGWWDWHPSKAALEFHWRCGALAVCRREAFRKIYDLSDRVIPEMHRDPAGQDASIDWACNAALDRLGFATSGEIAAFFDLVRPEEARGWCAAAHKEGRLVEVAVAGADGRLRRSFARPDVLDRAAEVAEPAGRVRILSPFDPALRDRARAERLFGFHYRIEIFVPEAKRRYGYYVFPVMEGDRLIGRIDMKAERADDRLAVRAFWPEPGVAMGRGRLARLDAELDRAARFSNVGAVSFAPGWLREN
ncbi:MAG: crosslink repair DNA glycosylase YcaQ family protein [Paracoccaceae bacterium]